MKAHSHIAIPWQTALHLKFSSIVAKRCAYFAADVKMCKQAVILDSIGISSDRSHCSRYIGRTASAAEPFLSYRLNMMFSLIQSAVFWRHLQRIHIEKALSIECHSCQNRVIQRLFHHIGIFTFRLNLQHSSCEKDKSDGSATL